MQTLKAGALYFGVIFGAGFILGFTRVLWLLPRVGERMAELIEAPVMLVVIIFAARRIIRGFNVPTALARRLVMGCVALGFLLIAEFGGVLWLRGMSIGEYFASRDPVALAVYIVMLGVFAVMPVIIARG